MCESAIGNSLNNNEDVDGAGDHDKRRESPIHLKTETNKDRLKIIRMAKEMAVRVQCIYM